MLIQIRRQEMTVPPLDFKEHIVSRTFSISFHQKKEASHLHDQASNKTLTLSMKKKNQKIVNKVKKNSEVEEREGS